MKTTLTVIKKTCAVTYELDDEARRDLEPLANEFEMSIEEFVTRCATWTLPGQLQKDARWPEARKLGAAIAQLIADSGLLTSKRLSRAASFHRESVGRFVWEAIGSSVTCSEGDMLLSPKTGKPLADRLYFDVDRYAVSRKLHSEAA